MSWTTVPLRKLITPNNRHNRPDLPLLSVVRDKGIIKRNLDRSDNHNVIPEDLSNYKVVSKGQFVINKMKAWQGSCGVSPYDGIVSPAYYVFDLNIENPRFFNYAIRSKTYIDEFNRISTGIRVDQWDLSLLHLKYIRFPLPPRAEQDQIVRFLDWKVSRINTIINAKRRQIGLLRERKQAVVNEAVTKGGEGWEYRKLKTLVKDVNEKGSPVGNFYVGMENIVSWMSTYVSTENTADGDCKMFSKGDVLFGKLRPYLAKVYEPYCDGVCSGEFLVLRGFDGYLPFLKYFLLSYDFVMLVNASTYGAKMPRANWDFIGNRVVSLPPAFEQKAIVAHLNNQCKHVDTIMDKFNHEITLLAEYRTRLISDAVTGRLDVRNIFVPEYDAVAESEPVEDGDNGVDGVDDEPSDGSDGMVLP